MAEEGIGISAQAKKVLTTDAVQASDVVITMDGGHLPGFSGQALRGLGTDDPPRRIGLGSTYRDEIKTRVKR